MLLIGYFIWLFGVLYLQSSNVSINIENVCLNFTCLISNYESSCTYAKGAKLRFSNFHIFIFKVGVTKGVDGSLKYSNLTALANCVLCISDGNNDPERGFSFRVFIRNGGLANIQVPSSLIRSSQNPRQRYKSYLVEKRRFEEEKEKNEKKIVDSQQKENEKTNQLDLILIY